MNNTITIEKVNDTQLRMSDNGITTTFAIKLVYDNRTHRNWIELPSNSIKRKYIPDNAFADATTIKTAIPVFLIFFLLRNMTFIILISFLYAF